MSLVLLKIRRDQKKLWNGIKFSIYYKSCELTNSLDQLNGNNDKYMNKIEKEILDENIKTIGPFKNLKIAK